MCCCRYEDKFFDSLTERLDEVLVMRETHVQLFDLLAANTIAQSVSAAAALLLTMCALCTASCRWNRCYN